MTSKYSSTVSFLIDSSWRRISPRVFAGIIIEDVSSFIVFPLVVFEIPSEGSPSILSDYSNYESV